MTVMASAIVAVGFVLHHGIPVQIDGVTNPYWTAADGNRADWFRWTTVLVIIAVGIFDGDDGLARVASTCLGEAA